MSEEKKTCHFLWNTTCLLLVSSLIPLGTRVQRLGGIFWERSFICVCYVCYCTTWISVLCIFLTHREADMVKLHALHIDVVVVSLFQVSWVKRTLAAVSYFTTEKKTRKKVLSFPLLAVQATVFCILQFCTSIRLLKCNLYSTFSPTRSVFMSIAVPLL